MADFKLRFIPLQPVVNIPLVLVWQEREDTPAVQRFREMVAQWQKTGRLWKETEKTSNTQ